MQLKKERNNQTEFDQKLKNCVIRMDDAIEDLDSEDLDCRLTAKMDLDVVSAWLDVYKIAMRQFYGLNLCFSSTDEYFGACTEDGSFWLFKIERKLK